jgi:hypothetical protein
LLEQALTEIDGAAEPSRVVRLTQNKPGFVGLGVQPAKGAAAWSQSLVAPEGASGTELEITELAGQPGTAVEAGGLVLRLVDFSRILVRLDFPAEGARMGPPPREVDLTAMPGQRGNTNGGSSASVKGDLVGPAPQVDAASQFVGYWYAVRGETRPSVLGKTHASPSVWRPGLFLQSAVESSSSTEQEAISVPAKAVLYHQGRAWVYRLHDSSTSKEVVYLRREVEVLGYEGDRCILAPPSLDLLRGVSAGDDIVADHPQVLLSTEFRPEADPD